jgi:hypothetical protein
MKRLAARSAKRLGHELGPWHHDLLCLLAITECRVCGATVRIRQGEIHGDATTDSCPRWVVNGYGANGHSTNGHSTNGHSTNGHHPG